MITWVTFDVNHESKDQISPCLLVVEMLCEETRQGKSKAY